jgi:hypothetical protein
VELSVILLTGRKGRIGLRIIERSLQLGFESMSLVDRPDRLEHGAAEELVSRLVHQSRNDGSALRAEVNRNG